MSFQGRKEDRGKAKSGAGATAGAAAGAREGRKKAAEGDVGAALRSAYQRTVQEDIPPEMLDLLGRLT